MIRYEIEDQWKVLEEKIKGGLKMLVYLHLAEGFEEIEALTVVDVLRRANIDIKTVSITDNKEVAGAHGIKVRADIFYQDADYSKAEMIVLPGGMPGTVNLEKHKGLTEKIVEFHSDDKWLAAICAAPSILGKLGLLDGKEATCYPGFERYLTNARYLIKNVVSSDKIVTSRGPGTALDFAYELVKIIKGKDLVEELKEAMIYKNV